MKNIINTLIAAIIVINNWVGNTEYLKKSIVDLIQDSLKDNKHQASEVYKPSLIPREFPLPESLPVDLNCSSSSDATYYLGPAIPEIVSLIVDEPDDIGRDKDGIKGVITTDYYVGAIFRYSIAPDFDGPEPGDVKGWRDQFENNVSSTQLWHWSYNDSLGGGSKPDNGSFCSSINNPLDNKTSAEICNLVCPSCMTNVSTDGEDVTAIGCNRNKGECVNGGLEVRAGFFLHVNKIIEEAMSAHFSDIQLIYYGVPKSLPSRSKLSDNQPKNGSGDSRDCDVSRCSDNRSGTGDPIDVLTGNFDYSYTDLSLQTIAGELSLQRSYASQATDIATHPTDISPGWTHNQDIRLLFENNTVWFKGHTLNQYRFNTVGDHLYSPYNGVLAELVYNDGQYLLTTSSQSLYLFNNDGRLLNWTNERGYGFNYYYSGVKLERVTEPTSGRYLQFNYLGGSLQNVTDSAGRQVVYEYNLNSDLTGVTDVRGNTWGYSYNDDHQITTVYTPGLPPEVLLSILYDSQSRAYKQHDGAGNLLTHIEFEPDGSSTSIDARGISTNYTPDCRGVVTRTNTPVIGSIQEYFIDRGYDHNFNLTSIRGKDDKAATKFKWSLDGTNLLEMTDQEGQLTTFSYDDQNHLTEVDTPDINSIVNQWISYNYEGPLITSTIENSSLGEVDTNFSYTNSADTPQPINLLKSITDALGHQTSFTYDSLGQLISLTDDDLNTTHFTYNATGQIESITDAIGRVVFFEYDSAGAVTKIVENFNPDRLPNEENQFNISTSYFYDLQGRLVTVKDTNNITDSTTVFDDAGRIYKLLDAYNNPTTYIYNEDGTLDSVLIAPDHLTSYDYDNLGRVTEIRDSLNHLKSAYTYNADSTIATEKDDTGLITSYKYDALHRIIQVSDNVGHVVSTTYNPFSDATYITDALGRITYYEYSDPGRLAAVVENYLTSPPPDYDVFATNIRTEYTYNILGNLVQIKNANDQATDYSYNDLYRLESVTDPLGYATSYTYDALGNLKTLTRPDTTVTQFDYDLVNRLTGIDYPGGSDTDVRFSYNALGLLTSMDDSLGHTAWKYTLLRQPELITDPFNNTIAYYYNSLGNRTQMIYAGRIIRYEYYANGLLEEVLDGTNPIVSYGYDNANRLQSKSYTNSLTSSYTYDLSSQLTSITHQLSGHNLAHFAYKYDLAGNLINTEETSRYPTNDYMPMIKNGIDDSYPAPEWENSIPADSPLIQVGRFISGVLGKESVSAKSSTVGIPPDQIFDYTYDALDRLKGASSSTGMDYAYNYDKVGNRTSQTLNGITTLYFYDIANRLDSVNGVNYTWNENGSLLNDGLKSYTYNLAGQLSGVNYTNHHSTYLYDGLGNRYLQTNDGQTTIFTLDLAAGLTQVLREGNTTYLFGLGMIGQETSGDLEIALTDRLGSVRQLITEDQKVTLLKSYDPFGNTLFDQGDGESTFGYSGEYFDASGLEYLRARYYDPETGRFISVDPFPGLLSMPATQNAYVYGINNPLVHTDHSGQFLDTFLDAAFFAWDIHDVNTKIKNGCEVSVGDWLGLGLDAASLLIPFLPAIGGILIRGASHTDDIYDAGRLINSSTDFIKKAKQLQLPGFDESLNWIQKIVPNPNGRKGGQLHQQSIEQIIDYIKNDLKMDFRKEFRVLTPGGKKTSRYIDVVAINQNGPVAFYQIGRVTARNNIVSRELEALADIYSYSDNIIPVTFIPYN